jgi:hypothetical protein
MPEIRREIERRINDGVDYYLVCGWPGEGVEQVREFAETVMPDYR